MSGYIYLFRCTPEGELPSAAIGCGYCTDGGVAITFNAIKNSVERDLGASVSLDTETEVVMAVEFYQVGSIDSLIAQAEIARNKLLEQEQKSAEDLKGERK